MRIQFLPDGSLFVLIITQSASYMRIQFLPDGSLFVLIITNKVVIKKKKMFYAIINYQFKTSELKNVEKLVTQTVQPLKALLE